ncbi:MAG: GntR family transcriptional regulator [Bacteroidetes bacterium CG2_30_33_31]|nr:MAG: GntR family transcriptional regulator [Bacteroidetes bacterium CG2_30_33_31]
MEIGKINLLKAVRTTDNGYYLEDEDNNEVLMPNAYIYEGLKIGDDLEVFIYKDSEDRIVATTLHPYVLLGEFAYLQVIEVNNFGAFMDWGLPKDLLIPYANQADKMEEKRWYLIYLLKDETTDRLIGTSKINPFLYYEDIDVAVGEEVDLLLFGKTELGMNAIVNDKYRGLIFNSSIHKTIEAGDRIKGYVKTIRADGKLDIVLEPMGYSNSINKDTVKILTALADNNGFLNLTDKSDPDDINEILGMSKKAFKRGLGNLYKQKLIELSQDGVKLV